MVTHASLSTAWFCSSHLRQPFRSLNSRLASGMAKPLMRGRVLKTGSRRRPRSHVQEDGGRNAQEPQKHEALGRGAEDAGLADRVTAVGYPSVIGVTVALPETQVVIVDDLDTLHELDPLVPPPAWHHKPEGVPLVPVEGLAVGVHSHDHV